LIAVRSKCRDAVAGVGLLEAGGTAKFSAGMGFFHCWFAVASYWANIRARLPETPQFAHGDAIERASAEEPAGDAKT
jgi:hypothetical protein